MVTILVRAILLYVLMIFVMRLMGKRQLGQLQPFELVITLLIADIAATPMADVGTPLLYGVLSILALLLMHTVFSLLSIRSEKFRAFLCGTPSILVKQGVIQVDELRRLCFDLSDLLEGLRSQGILNPSEVGSAILETNGTLTVFPAGAHRPVTPTDLGIDPGYEGIPLTLVLDGALQVHNLKQAGLDEAWLAKQLQKMGLSGIEQVFFSSLDTQGKLFVQSKGSKSRVWVAESLDPAEIRW